MSKRFQPMKEFATAKKPKLDISINRGRVESAFSSNNNKCAAAPKQPASIAIDWDDDDDDVILLATQQAEAAVRQSDVILIAESEMTFTEFAPQIQGSTSTQQILPPPASKPKNIDIDALFDDDDDFDLAAVAAVERKTHLEEPFAKPAPASLLATKSVPAFSSNNELPSSQTAARRQLAQERQMKFLMERVDVLKKENVKLQKDLGDTKERIESKDGETNLLRDELRHLRHQLQTSKMEKLKLAETAKSDCNSKVADVFKQVAAKETELRLKDVDYSRLKMRHSIETKQFEMSMCVESSTSILFIDNNARRNMLRLHNFNIDEPGKQIISNANASVFDYTKEIDGKGKKQRSLFETELEQLLLGYAQLQAQASDDDGLEEASPRIIARLIASVCKVFPEFWSYAHSLDFPQNCVLYPYHSYVLQSDQSASLRQSLSQPSALYDLERAISLRRYIATLALMCAQSSDISQALLRHKHGEYWLLQIANDAIAKLGYSNEICEHFGVLEAMGALLRSLLGHLEAVDVPQLELLFDLLKQLVFTRPSPWIFRELSACLLICSRRPELMAQMCVNSPKECFASDRVRSLYRFGPDSCLLQVYAGLLELAFFSDLPLLPEHFKLLLNICEQHVRFVYQCFTNPPDFILEMLPSFADDEESNEEAPAQGNSTTTLTINTTAATHGSMSSSSMTTTTSDASTLQPQESQLRSCECYVKLCLSAVTLVFQMLHQWMLNDRKTDTSQVGEISQVAVHLLTLIFREYYLTCLFRDSEETTKHYLSLICDWWQEYAELLGFQALHMRFLKHLQDSHFMLRPMYLEANPSNPDNDLLEWKRIVNNADAHIEPYVNPNDPFNCYPLSAINTRKFFDGLKSSEDNFE